jgi:sterol desaturase/sphingolipid hydroxylase (fatty acid hydroxylase superfamily)
VEPAARPRSAPAARSLDAAPGVDEPPAVEFLSGPWFSLACGAALAAAGWALWPLLEYGVHGGLAHGMRTPVTPFHWAHHESPARVFTSPLAWIPGAGAIWAVLGFALGPGLAGAFTAGVLAGFFRYEYVHWRIHFRSPRDERERRRRAHHLAHHERNPAAYYGVTTDFWDRVFGSLPPREERERDQAAVRERAPLAGPSNLGTWIPHR